MVQLGLILIICNILLEFPINCEECTTGAITGISCPSSKTIVGKYKIPTETLRDRLTTIYQQTGERITFTRDLILRNIADSLVLTKTQLTTTKKLLLNAKDEVKFAPLQIQSCINKQNFELTKILPNSLNKCSTDSNFNRLRNVRNRIIKLQQLLNGLNDKCIFLNPISGRLKNLDLCISTKIKEIGLDLLQLQRDFEVALKDVVNMSVRCILKESSEVHEKIGRVLGAVRNCRNIKVDY